MLLFCCCCSSEVTAWPSRESSSHVCSNDFAAYHPAVTYRCANTYSVNALDFRPASALASRAKTRTPRAKSHDAHLCAQDLEGQVDPQEAQEGGLAGASEAEEVASAQAGALL